MRLLTTLLIALLYTSLAMSLIGCAADRQAWRRSPPIGSNK